MGAWRQHSALDGNFRQPKLPVPRAPDCQINGAAVAGYSAAHDLAGLASMAADFDAFVKSDVALVKGSLAMHLDGMVRQLANKDE